MGGLAISHKMENPNSIQWQTVIPKISLLDVISSEMEIFCFTGEHLLAQSSSAPNCRLARNRTLERFGRNSKWERQSNMTKIEALHNIV
jgi:hypothetical protein